MPEYLSPGVYIEEVDAGPRPIAAVSTSTAGMVGVTQRGPTDGKPVLVTSFADFTRVFGSFLPTPTDPALVNFWIGEEGGHWWQFALSVQGFFANGGRRLYVKRAFSSTATPASVGLGAGFLSQLAADVRAGATSLRLEHLVGLAANAPAAGTQFDVVRGDTQAVVGTFNVGSYDAATRTITLAANATIPEDLQEGRDFVEIHARTAANVLPGNETLFVRAVARGVWGNDLAVRTRPVVGAEMDILPDPGEGPLTITRTVGAAAQGATTLTVEEVPTQLDATTTVPFTVLVNGRAIVVSAVAAGANPGEIDLTVPALADPLPVATSVRVLRPANLAAPPGSLYVSNPGRLYVDAIVELDNGNEKEVRQVAAIAGQMVTFANPPLTNQYLEGHRLRVVEAEVSTRYTAPGAGPEFETFGPLRLADDGTSNFVVTHVNGRSRFIRLEPGPAYSASDITRFPTPSNGGYQPLVGGDDALAGLRVDDFVGVDGGSGARTGIQALEDIDDVAICAVPGVWSRTVQSALIQHCELLKDRFAVLDPQHHLSIADVRSARAVIDTKYAALYYPWVVVRDPLLRSDVPLAPSGHVLGVYARVDVDRGVHNAPANEVIRGISRLDQDVTTREQDVLNPDGINALRFFPNRGNRVWGARTLSSDSTWRYVNVRRLFIMIEESIDEGTQFVVFEPNTPDLWARVRQTITNFLTTIWRTGALFGTTADEAFFVRCDETTMTQDDIDNGRLICVIGIAPAKPAEFVIFRIEQKTRELQPA